MKKNKIEEKGLPNFKTNHIAAVIKTVRCWWSNRHINQRKRIENPEIAPHKYAQLIFDKDAKPIQWRKHNFSNK